MSQDAASGELPDALDPDTPDEAPPDEPSRIEEPKYASVYDWFIGYFAQNYTRQWGGKEYVWCDKWWKHDEAVARLTAVWQAWEVVRLEPPEALSSWWLQHADPHMSELTSPSGPFCGCRKGHASGGSEATAPATADGWVEYR